MQTSFLNYLNETHTTDYRKKTKTGLHLNKDPPIKNINIIHTAIYNNLPKYIRYSIKLKEITKLRSSNSILLKT